jgi:quercetin dioxygenase-like cupin family protein
MEDRVLDQPMMSFAIPDEIERIRTGPQWSASRKGSITLAKTDAIRVVLMVLSKGMVLREHEAEGSITVSVAQGSIRFDARGERLTLSSGGLLTLGGGIRHEVEALEDSAFVITIALGQRSA